MASHRVNSATQNAAALQDETATAPKDKIWSDQRYLRQAVVTKKNTLFRVALIG